MELSPSWEPATCVATQELLSILWNPKVHYRVHKSTPLIPIRSYINPIHIIPSYLSKIHFNIVHPSTFSSSQWLLLSFPLISYMHSSSPQFMLHTFFLMLHESITRFNGGTETFHWGRNQTFKILRWTSHLKISNHFSFWRSFGSLTLCRAEINFVPVYLSSCSPGDDIGLGQAWRSYSVSIDFKNMKQERDISRSDKGKGGKRWR
jgi:hypothetical protein